MFGTRFAWFSIIFSANNPRQTTAISYYFQSYYYYNWSIICKAIGTMILSKNSISFLSNRFDTDLKEYSPKVFSSS